MVTAPVSSDTSLVMELLLPSKIEKSCANNGRASAGQLSKVKEL